jgi:periplasmic protein TonB
VLAAPASELPAIATTAATTALVIAAPSAPAAPLPSKAPATPAPAVIAPTAAALTPAMFTASYLQNPKPVYPVMSKRLKESGTVLLWVSVTAAGTVDDLGLLRPSGYPRLDAEALKTVKLWRFVPAKRGSEAVADKVSVPIEFGL